MHNIVISFSINFTILKVKDSFSKNITLPDGMLFNSFTLLLKKKWLLKQVINSVQSITKSDPAIQIERTTFCNISTHFELEI